MGRSLTITDWFCGIGGIRLGLEWAGHRAVWSCEIDPFARRVYGTRFAERPGFLSEPEAADVNLVRVGDVPDVDLWVGGAPCQSVSSAGKRAGLGRGTKSGLFWTWLDLLAAKGDRRPEWFLYENVPGLLSSAKGDDFAGAVQALDDLGYDCAYRTLDARRFGVPQRRRRVFLLCRRRDRPGARPWEVFDVPVTNGTRSKSGAWLNSGGSSHGRSWTVRVKDEWLPEAFVPSSLRDVLERGPVPSRFFLSCKACAGILRRAARRGRALPEALERALRGVAGESWVPDNANAIAASAGHHGHSSPRGDGSDNLVAFPIDMAKATDDRDCRTGAGTKATGVGRDGDAAYTLGVTTATQAVAFSSEPLAFNLAQVTHPENRSRCAPGDPAPTLAASGEPAHVVYQQHGSDVGPMGTLRRGRGDVQSGVPFIVNAAESCAVESHARETDVARCVDTTGSFAASQGGTVVVHETGQGWWKEDDASGTLRCEGENRPSRPSNVVVQPVAFSCKDDGRDVSDVAPTLRSMNYSESHMNGGGQVAVACFKESQSGTRLQQEHGTLDANKESRRQEGVIYPRVPDTLEVTGVRHAAEDQAHAREILLGVRKKVGEEAFTKQVLGILVSLQSAEVLQPSLHGEELRRSSGEGRFNIRDSALALQESMSTRAMREVRKDREDGCSPQERESSRQQPDEPWEVVSILSSERASRSAFLFGLWEASEGIGILRQALSAFQEVGRPSRVQEEPTYPEMLVRRLTPVECERLMGLPDFWTMVEWGKLGKKARDAECPVCYGAGVLLDTDWTCSDPDCLGCQWAKHAWLCHACEGTGRVSLATASDSQRYRCVGNSVAVPVLEAIGRRLALAD